jgi:L-lysine exporter family protein LysE/ArgO
MLLALLRGILVGFIGGIPVGPVNAAVIDTAMRKCVRRAIFVGMGGAFVDFLYSQLGTLGLGSLLDGNPKLATAFVGIGGVVLVVVGLMTVTSPPIEDVAPPPPPARRALVASFFSGAFITLANPAALVSWVLIAGTVLAGMTPLESFIAGIGIFIGTTVWFIGIAWLAAKGRVKLGPRAAWITRTVGGLLVGYGVFLVGKASATVLAAIGA